MGGRRHAATTQGFHWTGLVQPLETFASFLLLFLVVAGEGDCTKTREELRRELEIGLRRI